MLRSERLSSISGIFNVLLTSLRREAQQVCLIFHTTAATSSSDRKQLGEPRGNENEHKRRQ